MPIKSPFASCKWRKHFASLWETITIRIGLLSIKSCKKSLDIYIVCYKVFFPCVLAELFDPKRAPCEWSSGPEWRSLSHLIWQEVRHQDHQQRGRGWDAQHPQEVPSGVTTTLHCLVYVFFKNSAHLCRQPTNVIWILIHFPVWSYDLLCFSISWNVTAPHCYPSFSACTASLSTETRLIW